MNYSKIYSDLIARAKERTLEGYVERHHIIPKCMGGLDSKENLVPLTPEEHYIAHLLLVKIYPSHEGLIYSANMMQNRVSSNKQFGWVKRKFSELEKKRKTGIPRSLESIEKQKASIAKKWKGKRPPYLKIDWTTERREEISKRFKGKPTKVKSRSSLEAYVIRYGETEGTERYQTDSAKKDHRSLDYFVQKYGEIDGPVQYKQNCDRISELCLKGEDHPMFGKTHSDEAKRKIAENTSKHQKGRVKSEEHRKKIGAANKGKQHTVAECPHCGKAGGVSSMKRWHFDNCKLKP